ncbi:hypothetical protein NDU88_008111 [Pleurodeles waltl]|uniref:Uncharacterized protein n=1 Tax=Pleurodeles waltl TaxID=8319 RepID=A0AAV7VRL7_PLEWA|nr:hypothetical protein NDU88_008111 [Pleurodeles waltl]
MQPASRISGSNGKRLELYMHALPSNASSVLIFIITKELLSTIKGVGEQEWALPTPGEAVCDKAATRRLYQMKEWLLEL